MDVTDRATRGRPLSQTDLREGGSRNRSKNIAFAHSRAMSLAVLMFLMLPMMSIPSEVVSAAQTTVNYSIRTQDHFPDVSQLDVIVQTDWSVQYTANDGSGTPGTSVSYPITATAGPGSITVWWWYNGTLVEKNGSQAVPHNTPIGDETNIPIPLEAGIIVWITIHASIDSVVSSTGPGSVSPSTLSWTSWGTQTAQVSVNSGAQNGETIALSTATTYTETLTVTFASTFPPENLSGSPISMMGAGDSPLTNTVTVVAPPIPEFSVFLPVAIVTILTLLLCGMKRRWLSG